MERKADGITTAMAMTGENCRERAVIIYGEK